MTLLFVYGTLRPAARDLLGRPARDRLAREAMPIGPAKTAGFLFDLGCFPGLWVRDGDHDEVVGYIVSLAKPARTFAWLDLYEGIDYQRMRRTVILAAGGSAEAWMYHLRRKPQAPRMATGDWLGGITEHATALRARASSPRRRSHRSRS